MTRNEFCKPYLVALYLKNRSESGIVSSVDDLQGEFDLPRDDYLESEVVEHLNFQGVTISPPGEFGRSAGMAINSNGKAIAENYIEEGIMPQTRIVDEVAPNGHTRGTGFGSGTFGEGLFAGPNSLQVNDATQPQIATSPTITAHIDSTKWTGLPSNFQLVEEKRVRLAALLSEAEYALDQLGAGNSEKAMARAYIVAARTLAEAPDPPTDLIWEIIGRANSLAGIASLFVSIIALFQVAH